MTITILATNKRVLKWLLLYNVKDASKRQKFGYFTFTCCIFIGNFSVLLSSLAFAMEYVSIDLVEALYGVTQFNSYLCPIYLMLIGFILRKRITAIIDALSRIYVTCMFLPVFEAIHRMKFSELKWNLRNAFSK